MADPADSTATPVNKAYEAWQNCQIAFARYTLAVHVETATVPETIDAADETREAYDQALIAFMFYPATEPYMLRAKLDWFISEASDEHFRSGEFLSTMAADARRIEGTYFEVCQKAEKAEKRAQLVKRALACAEAEIAKEAGQ
ncbi:hypothetical protein [Sandaracinobacteroides hominis]|uniref:hypothetical protein n=1 Tax=Sandaracinobacteroides hominis TaxID=2780086 RepID=UPI0018F77B8D|nr:hypothetical protein [Sandaracinobacteroides hominis]